MLRHKQRIITNYLIGIAFICMTGAGIIRFIAIPRLGIASSIVDSMYYVLFIAGFSILAGYVIVWCISHKLYKGIRYAFLHTRIMQKLKKAFLNAGYYTERIFRGEKIAVLPKIKIIFCKNLSSGTIFIENNIKLNKRLEDVDLSSALRKYIVEQQYISDDSNYYIYEFEDSSIDRQLVFNSYKEFIEYVNQINDYTLFMDSKNHLPISSMLLCGATGSGKTYALYTLVLTMLQWNIKPHLYFADPKNSSLIVLGNRISTSNTAGTVEEIIVMLEKLHDEMQKRKEELKERLNEKLDSDYRFWNLEASVMIFDEYASFYSVIATMDKKTRDHVSMLLRNIVLQGRQLGFFLWIVMQKSDSTDLPTSIRDNLIWKVVLGNAPRTTYITTFGESANLPARNFSSGKGLFSYQGLTRDPQITSFPTLNFDILDSL